MIRVRLSEPQPSSTTLGFTVEETGLELSFVVEEAEKLKLLKELLQGNFDVDDDLVTIRCGGAGCSLEDRIMFKKVLEMVAEGEAKIRGDWGEHGMFSPFSDYGAATNAFDTRIYLMGLHMDVCTAGCPMCYLATKSRDVNEGKDREMRAAATTFRHAIRVIEDIVKKEWESTEGLKFVRIYVAHTTPDVTISPWYYNHFWRMAEHLLHIRGYERMGGFAKTIEKEDKRLDVVIKPVVSTTPWFRDREHLFMLEVEPDVITLTYEPRQFGIDKREYDGMLVEKIDALKRRYSSSIVLNVVLYRYRDEKYGELLSYLPPEDAIVRSSYVQLVSYHPVRQLKSWRPPTKGDIVNAVGNILMYAPMDKLIFDASSTVRLFSHQADVVAWVHRMEHERYYRCSPLGCANNLACPRGSDRCIALETG